MTDPLPLGRRASELYQALREVLRSDLPQDGRLPSEHELCAAYDISRTAVRRALARLSAEGLIRVEHGRGAFATALARAETVERRSNVTAVMFPFDTASLVTIQAEILDRGLLPALFSQRQTGWDAMAEQRFLQALLDNPPQALLAFCTPTDRSADEAMAALTSRGTRCIHLDLAGVDLPAMPFMAPDFTQAGYEAAARARNAGHTQVVPVVMGDAPYERRFQAGLAMACATLNLGLRPPLVVPGGLDDAAAVRTILGPLLDAVPDGTALACRSLDLAVLLRGALTARPAGAIGLVAVASADEPDQGIDRLEHDRLAIIRRALDLTTASTWQPPRELVPHAYRQRGSLSRSPRM
jgi:DNA-binding LacI/PurR family transcriptional regulator